MNRWMILGIALLLIGGGGVGVKLAVDAQRPQGDDDRQIRMMLYEAERAAERQSISGVTHYISEDYSDGLGMNAPRLKYAIRDWMRQRDAVEVNIPSESIHVQVSEDGKTAAVQFQLQLGSSAAGGAMAIGLKLVKEPVRYYWLFPGEEWRVVGAEGYTPIE
jgi:hypothetical protein